MSKFINKLKETKLSVIIIYLALRILVITSLGIQIFLKNYLNVALCSVALIGFSIPSFLKNRLKIELPNLLEAIVYIFIFASAILGEINSFYIIIPFWDTMLHIINGFISAGVGFSLVDLLNKNSKNINLSPIYIAIVAFCFSMTIGVFWEFFEFGGDQFAKTDMQKDKIVKSISSILINEKKENQPVVFENIESTTIKNSEGEELVIEGGYLDLGKIDTMKDLFVNLIGAISFSIIGYIYVKNRESGGFLSNFIPRKM